MRKIATAVMILGVSTFLTTDALAQGFRWRGGGGWGNVGRVAEKPVATPRALG